MDTIQGSVLGVTEKANYFLSGLPVTSWPLVILDIIIVSLILYWAYLFLKETRAMRILYGLLILLTLVALARVADLVLLNWLLGYITTIMVVAIPIVFQPELRGALERLGRARILTDLSSIDESETYREILKATMEMSRQKIGALMIIQRKTGLREFAEQGTKLNANLSSDLLLSIFNNKAPLHDGAVIIDDNKIVASSVNLPLSEIDSKLGFRHRAGLGITENSDAISIIVSEETGSISLAVGGEMERRISEDRLKNRLVGLLSHVKKD